MKGSNCDKINKELKEKGYDQIKATIIIPMVNVLRKLLKGKMVFEEVPVLFNYGFMRMPTKLAFSSYFYNKLRRNISGIRTGYVMTHNSRKKKVRIDNAEDFDDFSLVAIVVEKK